MDIDALISAIHAIDTNNSILIFVLCLVGTYLFHRMVEAPFWAAALTLLAMLASAFIGVAALKISGLLAAPEPGVLTIVGAIAGMTVCFALIAVAYCIAAECGRRAPAPSQNSRPTANSRTTRARRPRSR